MENDTLSTLTGQIEKDNNFIKARRILVTLSIILIGLVTLGITVQEVNTFVFKLSIDNPQYLGLLIFISLVLSIIRYYSYAFSYQNKLKKIWCKKVIKDEKVFIPLALIQTEQPYLSSGALDRFMSIERYIDPSSIAYKAKFPFRRYVTYVLDRNCFQSLEEQVHEDGIRQRQISIYKPYNKLNILNARKVLKIELKYRLEIAFRSRVYLDIYYPYCLAIVSIVLYFFPESIL